MSPDGPRAWRWLVRRVRGRWSALAGSVLGSLATAGFAVLAPVVSGFAFDAVLDDARQGPVLAVGAAVLLVSQLLRAGVMYLRQRAAIAFAARVERELRSALLSDTLRHGDPARSGSLAAGMVGDLRALRAGIFPGLDTAVSSLAFVALAIAVAPFYHPALVVAPAVFAAGYLWVGAAHLRSLTRTASAMREGGDSLGQLLGEALDNIEAVRDAALPEQLWRRLRAAAQAQHDASVRQGRAERRNPMFLLLGVVQGVGFGHALVLAHLGTLSPGDLVGYTGALMLLGAPAFSAGFAFTMVAGAVAATGRLAAAFPDEPPAPAGRRQPAAGVPTIALERVVLDVPGGAPDGAIDLVLEPRSLVVVSGASGVGKTVLARTIAGLRPPRAGRVLVDGTATGDWDAVALARVVALVGEDEFLFSLSVAENLRLVRPDASRDEMVAAARRARVDDVIDRLPLRYDTPLGEGGGRLSGGQRDRVALARALLSPAPVLVLDDPFSALDPVTARQLTAELLAVARERTVVVVTDRPDLADQARLMIHLSDGPVAVRSRSTAQEKV
ncbi:ABC transporter ATP-binding protein [Micromonospora sp. NPDC050495]|uniref:ABC transporter ATP-binding protein n=1 Tax=Micromonospora sp. NPDC050495 TaxID=3154936 RepID=UPI0033DDAA6A